jgi:hypothetical protein
VNNRLTRTFLLLIITAAFVLAARSWRSKRAANTGPLSSAIPDFGSAVGEFKLSERTERGSVTQLTLTNGDAVLKIESIPGLDREAAERLEQDGIMGLEALYADALSPYPGDISSKVVTDERFRPRQHQHAFEGATNSYFLLYANSRRGYGALTRDEARFRSVLGWRYCARSRTFYKVRLFLPLKTEDTELHHFFTALRCLQ